MGGAMAEGFVKSGAVSATDVCVTARHTASLERFEKLGMKVTTCNEDAVKGADIVVIAVKPWLAESVISEIKPHLDYGRQTIISVMAGVSSEKLMSLLERNDGYQPHIFIAIPNIAIARLCSMTFLVPVTAFKEDVEKIKALFDAVGDTIVTDEHLLGAGCTLASCGIAYALRYIRAATEGGVELGFKAKDAQRIVAQTVMGAASLLQVEGAHAEAEIDKVTTPGGLTIRGLNAMEHAGFTSAVIKGLKAGVDKQ